MPDLPVRDVVPAHRFDEGKLAAWMAANVEGYRAPLRVQQFQGGASNPTFLLTGGDGHLYVLRKRPPGQLLSSAHQVDREYRAMKALAGHIPVPVMRALCEDPEVIGTTFYVMDYLEGRIFRDATLPGLEPAERAAIYDDLIATLDWELSTIGHPIADIAYNAFLWRSHSPGWGSLDGVDFKATGIPTEADYVAAYCRRTGRDGIEDWPFYMAFGIFRLASISQGVYRRVLAGNAASEGREAVNGTKALAEQSLAILRG